MKTDVIWMYLVSQIILLIIVNIKFGFSIGIITWAGITIINYWITILTKRSSNKGE